MYIIQPLLLFMCLFCLTPPSASGLSAVKDLSSHLKSYGADVCLSNNKMEKTYLLIVVNSLSYNVDDRQRTRVTWRNHWATKENRVRVVFFVDKPKNWVQMESLVTENSVYHDIVWSNVTTVDSKYSAMKSIAWLKWAVERCPKAKFVMKIEENVVVNLPAIFLFLEQNMKVDNTIWGAVSHGGLMNWIEKYLSNTDYCLKNAYLMTGDVVKKLYTGANKHIDYQSENAYLTGYVAKNEGIQVKNNDAFIEMDLPSKFDSDDIHLSTDKCSSMQSNLIYQTTDNKEEWMGQWSYLLLGLTNCNLRAINKNK